MIRKQNVARNITERKLAEKALQESEEKYKVLFSRQNSILGAIPDIIMEVNSKKIYTWANQAGYDFFGKDVIGKEASYYFEGDQKTYDLVKPIFNDKGNEGTIYLESWQRRKDGKKRLLAWRCKTLKDSNGKNIGAISSAQDITERKKAEQEIIRSNAFNASLIENAPFGVMTINPGGLVDYVNPALIDMSGASKANFHDMNTFKLPTYVKQGVSEKIRACFKGKTFFLGSIDYLSHFSHKKTVRNFTGIPLRNVDGKIEKVMLFVEDLTKQKEEEAELVKKEKFITSVLDNLPNMVFVKDAHELRFELFNKAGEKLLGYKREAMIGKNDYDFFPKKQADFFIAKDRSVLLQKKLLDIPEENINTKNGPRILHTKKIPIFDLGGKPKYLLGISEDITNSKKMELELLEVNERNRSFMNSTSDMVFLKDESFHYLMVNKANQTFFGKPESEIIGKTDFELMPVQMAKNCRVSDTNALMRNEAVVSHELVGGRVYEIKKFPVRLKKDTIGVGGFIRDITEQETARDLLKERVEFEKIVSLISFKFLASSLSKFDYAMNFSLQTICELVGYDRSYVFQIRDDEKTSDNTHEWCAKGIKPQINNLQGVLLSDELPWFSNRIIKNEIVNVPDVSQMPADAFKEKNHFAKQSIVSLIVLPLIASGKLLGFFGFDSVKKKKNCSDEEVSLLKLFGRILSDAIIRHKIEQQLLRSEQISMIRANETEIMNKIVVACNQANDLNQLLKVILDYIIKIFGFSGGGIYLRQEGESFACLKYFDGLNSSFVKAVREINISKSPFDIVFVKKQPIIADDYAPYHPAVAKKFHIASLASIPIFYKNQVIGAINIMSRKKHVFSDDEKRTINSIGMVIGALIVNMQSEENLKSKSVELEKFNKMTIGRELRMVELKKKIAELEKKGAINSDGSDRSKKNG